MIEWIVQTGLMADIINQMCLIKEIRSKGGITLLNYRAQQLMMKAFETYLFS